MATAKLTVTPEELEAEARKIESNTQLYVGAYGNIYKDVESLQSGGWWSGEANTRFMDQIRNFKKDFTALEKLLIDDFKRVLARGGEDYRLTEATLVMEAGKLPDAQLGR